MRTELATTAEDTKANTAIKRQVAAKDPPVGMRSKTIYGGKA